MYNTDVDRGILEQRGLPIQIIDEGRESAGAAGPGGCTRCNHIHGYGLDSRHPAQYASDAQVSRRVLN